MLRSKKLFSVVMLLIAGVFYSGSVYAEETNDCHRSSTVIAMFDYALPQPVLLLGASEPLSEEAYTSESVGQIPPDTDEILEIKDPIQGYNRVMFAGNDFFIMWLIRPASRVYEFIIPLYIRERIGHIHDNTQMPRKVLSNLCRGKYAGAGIEFSRFLINTTVGIAGAYDPAYKWWDLKAYPSDFGAAFADWGFKHGAYIVLPIQGSTSVRNGVGLIFDTASDPIFWVSWFLVPFPVSIGISGGLRLNGGSLVIREYERMHFSSIDPYMTMRNYWYLRRIYDIEQ
jgi:phospholipid-binding lipoprotein MlaA